MISLPTRLLTVAAIRFIESQASATDNTSGHLMRAAGRVIANFALKQSNGPFVVVAGPGNNGGDGIEAALLLYQAWRSVKVHLCTPAAELTGDAAMAYRRCVDAGVSFDASLGDIAEAAVVIDGLFGVGLARPISGAASLAVAACNRSRGLVIAIDVPSGLDADRGTLIGVSAIRADHTLTFIAAKPGLYTADGPDHAGHVHIDDLGTSKLVAAATDIGALNSPAHFLAAIGARHRNSHKGDFGTVAVIGGANGMMGASLLAGRAALYAGAGRVVVHALAESAPGLDTQHPELMMRPIDSVDWRHSIVIGPGLGQTARAKDVVKAALANADRLVLDADALNIIAGDPSLQRALVQREQAPLLTPHPLEAARLLDTTVDRINGDRVTFARQMAKRYNAMVVLKGAGSVIANTNGDWLINPTGNPGLACGGSGDVLAGLCGALLARSPAFEALAAAVWIHGAAADALVAQGIGPIGLTPSELMPAIRQTINALVNSPS